MFKEIRLEYKSEICTPKFMTAEQGEIDNLYVKKSVGHLKKVGESQVFLVTPPITLTTTV